MALFFTMLFPVALTALVFLATGCGAGLGSAETAALAEKEMLTYSRDAAGLYGKGMKKLEARSFAEAVKIFKELKDKYPISRYAQLADLRIADCSFEMEDYTSAWQEYKVFTQRYPSHKEVDYAYFKKALSTYKMIPGKVFVLPPVCERNQSYIKNAAREFKEMLDNFPGSPHAAEARRYYVQCLNLLAEHELYVARYYFKKGKFRGAINRCNTVISKLGDSEMVGEALLLLAECYMKMKKVDQAVATLEYLRSTYPSSFQAAQAGDYLKALK